MHIGNILGFGLLGLGMIFFPSVAPDLFPPEAGTGANLSGLWLQFMGWVNGAVGGVLWVRHTLVPRMTQLLAWRPAVVKELLPADLLRPALRIYGEIEPGARETERSVA